MVVIKYKIEQSFVSQIRWYDIPAPLRVVLTEAEDLTLAQLREATTVPKRTRDRAHMIRFNAQGWNVQAIAKIFLCHEHTVRAALQRWEILGLGGLWEASGLNCA